MPDQVERIGIIPLEASADERWAKCEDVFADAYAMNDDGDKDWLYERDGYKLSNCLNNDVFVLKSPYFTYARFCSPCVPGAGDLNAPVHIDTDAREIHAVCAAQGVPKVFCLGADFFEDSLAPYPIYSVETGLRIS